MTDQGKRAQNKTFKYDIIVPCVCLMLLEQMSRMDDEARSESCSAAGLLKATTRTQKSVLSP